MSPTPQQTRGVRCIAPDEADYEHSRQKGGSRCGRPPRCKVKEHKIRHAVECGVNHLERHRAVATGYGGPAGRYEATALTAAIGE